jgi:hypothetical protein
LSTADGSRPGAEGRAPAAAVAAEVAAEISRICSVCSAALVVSAFYLNFCPCCFFFFFYGPIFDFLSIRFFLFYSTNQVAQVKSGDNVFHFLDPNWETFGGEKKNWYKFGLIFNFWKSLPIFL